MAFVIKLKDKSRTDEVASEIRKRIEESRFTAGVDHDSMAGKISIGGGRNRAGVRLKKKKDYCGNHAGPCRFTGSGRKHRVLAYLEGSDWAAFDDMLNDVLDELNVEANVGSSHCIIRKGRLRRTAYSAAGEHGEWLKDEDAYEDHCGTKNFPKSEIPHGTPGIHSYLLC